MLCHMLDGLALQQVSTHYKIGICDEQII
jgi:hypothetical protein